MRMDSWIAYAVISLLALSAANFLFVFVSKENVFSVVLIEFLAAASILAALVLLNGQFSLALKPALLSASVGIALAIGSIFALKSISVAPNPGYAVAIFSSGFVIVTIASYFVLKSPLTLQKIAGIVATFIGLLLISL